MVKNFKNHKSYSESLETHFGCEFFGIQSIFSNLILRQLGLMFFSKVRFAQKVSDCLTPLQNLYFKLNV